jgi:hypothetical protein
MQRSRMSHLVGTALAAALLLGFAASLEAQTPTGTAVVQPAADVPKALGLEARAAALTAQTLPLANVARVWARAAHMYEEAAALRSDDDPERVYDRTVAGQLYGHAGRHEDAQRVLGAAAEGALQNGDVKRAAGLFIAAAICAQRAGDTLTANRLAHRAELLANSPGLSVADANAIRRRVIHAVEVVG